jgi:hypothetical protein
MTRARVRGLTSRITGMLKGYPGEPSEKGGRLCIAAPAGEAEGGGRDGREGGGAYLVVGRSSGGQPSEKGGRLCIAAPAGGAGGPRGGHPMGGGPGPGLGGWVHCYTRSLR